MEQPSTATPKRAMIIIAHPDDGEFMASGTLAKWAKEGTEVTYLLCTSGDKGTSDPKVKPEELAAIREVEQQNAANVVGAKNVAFLRYLDGSLQNTLELRKDIVRQIRKYQPDIVICQDPTRRYGEGFINHPDHRAAGAAALDAVFPSARDYHVYPDLIEEGYMPHNVLEIYMGAFGEGANVWVDITDTIDTKIAALMEHKTQMSDDPEQLEAMKVRMKENAAQAGAAHAIGYAESFRYIRLRG
jgi:LmbE family N-acetylglucosaminyl deacetylase